jgi:hypothetical protein
MVLPKRAERQLEVVGVVLDQEALGGTVPGGNVVNLERSKVTDQDLKLLLEFKEVGFLRLTDTSISDAGMATIGRLTKLRVLELAGTKITDTGLQQVSGLGELEQLADSFAECNASKIR